MRPDSSLHSDLLRAPHFEPKGPWPGWPTGQWTRQGDAAPVGAGSGSGLLPPSISSAAAWLLWRKAGIGGAWRAQPQTAWRWVAGARAVGPPGPRLALPPAPAQRPDDLRSGGQVRLCPQGRKDAHTCRAPCLCPRVARREGVGGPPFLPAQEKPRFRRWCVFPFDMGLLSRHADKQGKPRVGSQPPVTPRTGVGRSAVGCLPCPGVLFCFLVDGGWWGHQTLESRRGPRKTCLPLACMRARGDPGGPVCIQPAVGRARSRWPCGQGVRLGL